MDGNLAIIDDMTEPDDKTPVAESAQAAIDADARHVADAVDGDPPAANAAGEEPHLTAGDAGSVDDAHPASDADGVDAPKDGEAPDEGTGNAPGETTADAPSPDSEAVEIVPRRIVEAILFATDSPLPGAKIASIIGVGDGRDVRKHVESLNAEYAERGNAFRIERIAGGYRMMTLPDYNTWLTKLLRTRQEAKLTPASLETLAIIAYKQPCTRAEVEAVRGVAAGDGINRLREMNLVKIVGRAEDLGRPLLYGTTRRFLEVFGLPSLDDLPKVEALSGGFAAATSVAESVPVSESGTDSPPVENGATDAPAGKTETDKAPAEQAKGDDPPSPEQGSSPNPIVEVDAATSLDDDGSEREADTEAEAAHAPDDDESGDETDAESN